MANSRSGESVLLRAMRILQCFDVDKPRLTAGHISVAADLSRSTAHLLAAKKAGVGMLCRNADRVYSVSSRVGEVSVRANPVGQFRRLAQPVMHHLHSSLDLHISMAFPDSKRHCLLYLDRYDPTGQLTILTRHASGVGPSHEFLGTSDPDILAMRVPDIVRNSMPQAKTWREPPSMSSDRL